MFILSDIFLLSSFKICGDQLHPQSQETVY